MFVLEEKKGQRPGSNGDNESRGVCSNRLYEKSTNTSCVHSLPLSVAMCPCYTLSLSVDQHPAPTLHKYTYTHIIHSESARTMILTCRHAYLNACIHTQLHSCVCVCVCACECSCFFVCVYIHVYAWVKISSLI